MRAYSARARSLDCITCRNGVWPRAQLAPHQDLDQAAREAAARGVGMRAHAADLAQVARLHALSRHGDQARPLEHSDVFAEFGRPRAERARARERDQFEHPRRVFGSQPDGVDRGLARGRARRFQTIWSIVSSAWIRQPAGAGPDHPPQ